MGVILYRDNEKENENYVFRVLGLGIMENQVSSIFLVVEPSKIIFIIKMLHPKRRI